MPINNQSNNTVRVILNKGRSILVDEQDLHILQEHTFFIQNGTGYAREVGSGIQLAKHILGNTNTDLVTDHLNGNHRDYRRCNIRLCTQRNNTWNRGRYRGTRYKNIRKLPSGRYWARICLNGMRITHTFDLVRQAREWYDQMALVLFGEYARTKDNHPPRPVIAYTVSRDALCMAQAS